MRLGVVDVGSNTVHLLVVDAHRGAQPLPATSHKIELRLSEHVTDTGDIADSGEAALAGFVRECLAVAEDQGVEEVMAFATSAIREAPNGEQVLERVRADTGMDLQVLSGEDEARLTFLAARRWFGWSSGTLVVVDIGGGSLELAAGMDEDPDAAVSLPLGAGRLTRADVAGIVARVAPMTAAERAQLPGVSQERSRQLLAGALVAEAAMDLLDLDRLDICPWALREGVLLDRLDAMR